MIELKQVSKTYGKSSVLSDISFQIHPGELVCITGKSGAGKSTLLHLLTGAEPLTEGSLEIDGVDLRKVPPQALQIFRRKLGIVFQDYKLLPHRTVAENIAFPLEVTGVPDNIIQDRIQKVLSLVELNSRAHALPSTLSGGEQARTAIGRAIAHEPMIMLADEPTGNVDPEQSVLIMNLFKEIHKAGATVIIATHDSGMVDELEPRVIALQNGRVVRDSIGTYDEETTKAPTGRIGELHLVHQHTDESEQKRKVKVTSIG